MRLPNYGTNELSTLSEDMRVLDALTGGRKKPLAEESELHRMAVTADLNEDTSYDEDEEEDEEDFDESFDESFDEDEDEDLDEDEDEDEDLDEDEDFDVDDFFAEDSDEDLDEDIDEEDYERALEILESFEDLDEDEVDELSEEDLELVESAFELLESTKQQDAPAGSRFKKVRRFGKMTNYFNPDSDLAIELGAEKGNLKIAHDVIRVGQPKEYAIAARMLSKIAGPNYTLRGKGLSSEVLKEYNKVMKLKTKRGRKKAAQKAVRSLGGVKLIGRRFKIRKFRNTRRKQSKAFNPAFVESTSDLNNLIEEFRDVLSEGLDTSTEVESYESCESILEGFQKVGASAEELASRVANDMRNLPESEDPSEDPRFEVGCYLESIARDSGACLDRLIVVDDEGNPYFAEDVDVDVALEDLQSITNDLERGIGALADLDD